MDEKQKSICEKVLFALAKVNNKQNVGGMWWNYDGIGGAKAVLPLCYDEIYASQDDVSIEVIVEPRRDGISYARLSLSWLRFAKPELSPLLIETVMERYNRIKGYVEKELGGKRLHKRVESPFESYLLPTSHINCLDEKLKE